MKPCWSLALGVIALSVTALGQTWASDADPVVSQIINGEVLHANTVEFGLLNFRDVVTHPELRGRRLVFNKCQAKAYGGEVTGWLAVDLPTDEARKDSPTTYQAHFEVAKADLSTLLRQLGGNAEGLGGEVDGWVEFTLTSDHPENMTGRGELSVHKASLVQLPLLANLLIGDPSTAKGQDSLQTRFTLGEGRLSLVFARLDSPAAQIAISGRVGYDGDLHLHLEPTFANKISNALTGGFAATLLNPLTRRAGRFIVRGQITHPVLVSDPFGRQDN
jgi:hypothetical protein